MPEFEDLEISFPDGSECLRVVSLGANKYRLLDSCVVEADLCYGDTIEVARQAGETKFVRIVSKSGLKVTRFILSAQLLDAPELQTILSRVMESGGNWERAFDGYLIIHLHPDAPIDVEAELQELTRKRD